MDLKLKRLLEQAQFTKYKGRGYDAAEVDDFLDRATAMAAKVEVQLTEALGRSGTSTTAAEPAGPAGPSPEEIEAEIERRVAAHVAELPPPPAAVAAPVVDEAASARAAEEAAEEARRTLLLAQRTADAAIREAREEADRLRSEAQEHASTSVADAEGHAQRLRADAEAEASRERNDARERLAREIRELDEAREALRADLDALERHVEVQRGTVSSAIEGLQRLLDDPDGIRLAPAPATTAEVPDLAPAEPPAPPIEQAPAPVEQATAPIEIAPAPVDDVTGTPPEETASPSPSPFDLPPPAPRRGTSRFEAAVTDDEPVAAGNLDDIDHDAPGSGLVVEPDASGPPTTPVDAIDLDLDLDAAAAEGDGSLAEPSSSDDAFLAELRKAMADEEPLGPRDTAASTPSDLFGDDRPRRFGRRR